MNLSPLYSLRRTGGYFTVVLAIASGAVTQAGAGEQVPMCCMDLEQRVAELEASTAHKGTQRTSLAVSGYIAEQLTYWDDGKNSDVYLWGLGPTQTSNVRFSGQAVIVPGWTAGFMLRLQDLHDNPFGANQSTPISDNGLQTHMVNWSLASKDWGKITVGRQPGADKSVAMTTDLSGTQLFASYVLFDGAGFFLRNHGALSSVTWGQLGFCYSQARPWGGDCNGIVTNVVRYDSPAIGGFTLSSSWGEDDVWSVAGRYAAERYGFKLAAGIGYSEMLDEKVQPPSAPFARKDTGYFQIGGYLQHVATGLFTHVAYGYEDNTDSLLASGEKPLDGRHWYVKSGIRGAGMPLGHTIVWGEYGEYLDQLGPAALATGATGSELKRYGAGVAQEIDAAAMTIWLKYRHVTGHVESGTLSNLDDADFIGVGALYNF